MMKSCCFIGHNSIPISLLMRIKALNVIEELIDQGVTDFYAAGTVGWDMICEKAFIRLREEYPQIKLHLILSQYKKSRMKKKSKDPNKNFGAVLSSSDGVEFEFVEGCLTKRMAKIVELSDCCLCYYEKIASSSSTALTIRLAEKKGIKIVNLAE